ncbi:prohibitin family protein [candidate division WWE3 bacterium]|uniref:Prohibitin family protein n=1 Tax=candidate division WWE3 bacterium TaxID=2053526 RepID=A0A955LLE2_UNCKA|nr:prohibitin family protein [candidate division WWE3 bacterium]
MLDKLVVSILVDEVVGGFFISVPPGHVACVYDRGRGVLDKVWEPGLHLKIPFWQVAKLFNGQTLEYDIKDGLELENPELFGDEPIKAVSKDNKMVKIQGTLLLRINKNMLPQLWESVGDRFVSKIVRPVSRSRIRQVIAKYDRDDVLTHNRKEIEEMIKSELNEFFNPKGLMVEGVLLSEITPN